MPDSTPDRLIIASRESRLALWQAEHIKGRLAKLYPACRIDILGMTTRGDQILDRTLSKVGGKGLFVKELELAMVQGRAHLAVHSLKDVPMELPDGFQMVIPGPREDPRDAFVSSRYQSLQELPAGSVVGTSSLRRESQIRARFPHLLVNPLRGNVETRLRKLDDGQYAAIILAAAGLMRLGLGDRITCRLPPAESLPAVGQGALGIEFMAARSDVAGWLAPLHDSGTAACVMAERAMSRQLAGSCEVPLAGHAVIGADGVILLEGLVAAPDGSTVVRASRRGPASDPEALGRALAEDLLAQGAQRVLAALSNA